MIFFHKPKQPTIVRIEAKIVWQVAQDPDSGDWVGVCPMLNLNAIGDTWVEFLECANEVLGLLLTDLFKDGELEEFLRHNRWQSTAELPPPGSEPRFDVPFDWERASINELATATA